MVTKIKIIYQIRNHFKPTNQISKQEEKMKIRKKLSRCPKCKAMQTLNIRVEQKRNRRWNVESSFNEFSKFRQSKESFYNWKRKRYAYSIWNWDMLPRSDEFIMMWRIVAWKAIIWAVIPAISTTVQVKFSTFTLKCIDTAFGIHQYLKEEKSCYSQILCCI